MIDALDIAETFVKEREALRLKAYRDIAGIVTIGYGWTNDVKMGDVITQEEAEKRLRKRLEDDEMIVMSGASHAPSAHQMAAFLSLSYNIRGGATTVKKSTAMRFFNSGNLVAASKAFLLFNKFVNPTSGKLEVSNGLTARRQLEAALFLTPDDQTTIAGQPDNPAAHPYDQAPNSPSTAQSSPSHESLDQWLSGGLGSTGLGLAGQAMSSGAVVFGIFVGTIALGLAIYFFIRARNRKNGVT